MKLFVLILTILILSLNNGCGQKPTEEKPVSSVPEVPVKQLTSIDPSQSTTLKGKVTFEGQVPVPQEISVRGNPECALLHSGGKISSEELLVHEGNLENVFVYVKEGLEAYHFDVPSQPVTVSNKNCLYAPHVVGVQVGQSLEFFNEDSTLHNIHSYPKNSKPWNLGLPLEGMKVKKKFDSLEVMVALKCDVHPWMIGYVGVLPHPYFAVTDSQGNFEIKNLPPGEYAIEAWHEKLGVQSQKIKIEPRETKDIQISFKS